MNLFVSFIEESYKDTIIRSLVNSGVSYLLLHIVQCWHECRVDEENQPLTLVLYCSHIIYKYYYHLWFIPIKYNDEWVYIHNEIFNNIKHFLKICLHFDCLRDGFVMYNHKVIFTKREIIPPVPDSMIPVDFCQKNP